LQKDIVVGLGEIGFPLYKLFSKSFITEGFDINSKLIPKSLKKNKLLPIRFLHISIPFSKKFNSDIIKLVKKFEPKGIVIHSTIKPTTTFNLQKKLSVPVIYSATRGVHKRMLSDMKRYTKFFAIESDAPKRTWAIATYSNLMKKCGVKTKKMSDPITLELAKIICDTSYYGWLINYAQMSKMIATKNHVDYDEMWTFSDEIEKFLGNRPKMRPGYIGGHCVIPNLELVQNETLNFIKKINRTFYNQTNLKKRK